MAFLPMLEKRAGPLVDIFADGVARLLGGFQRERGEERGLAGVYVKPSVCGFFFFDGSGKNASCAWGKRYCLVDYMHSKEN